MLKIFLAVLSLSDPDKKKCFLNARKKEAAVTVLVVSSKAAIPSVFGSQKCTATQNTTVTQVKAPDAVVW